MTNDLREKIAQTIRNEHRKYSKYAFQCFKNMETGKVRDEADRFADAIMEVVKPLEQAKNEAYHERNQLVAALSKLFPAYITRTDIPGWDASWHGCVYINLPSGQISYHYHDSEHYLFADLPIFTGEWDGHDKDTVHRILQSIQPLEASDEWRNQRGV